MSKESEPSGLAVFDGKADDFIRKIAKNKKLEKEVRSDSDTDPARLERQRLEIGSILRIARANINRVNALFMEISTLKPEDERREEIKRDIANYKIQNEMMLDFAQLYAQTMIIDCISIQDEDDEGEGKKGAFVRTSLADMIARNFDDEVLSIPFAQADQVALLTEMMHCMGRTMGGFIASMNAFLQKNGVAPTANPNVFAGEVEDERGVAIHVPDKIEWLKKQNAAAAAEAARKAAEADKARGGVTPEEATKINNATNFDELFGGKP